MTNQIRLFLLVALSHKAFLSLSELRYEIRNANFINYQ